MHPSVSPDMLLSTKSSTYKTCDKVSNSEQNNETASKEKTKRNIVDPQRISSNEMESAKLTKEQSVCGAERDMKLYSSDSDGSNNGGLEKGTVLEPNKAQGGFICADTATHEQQGQEDQNTMRLSEKKENVDIRDSMQVDQATEKWGNKRAIRYAREEKSKTKKTRLNKAQGYERKEERRNSETENNSDNENEWRVIEHANKDKLGSVNNLRFRRRTSSEGSGSDTDTISNCKAERTKRLPTGDTAIEDNKASKRKKKRSSSEESEEERNMTHYNRDLRDMRGRSPNSEVEQRKLKFMKKARVIVDEYKASCIKAQQEMNLKIRQIKEAYYAEVLALFSLFSNYKGFC